MLRMALASPQLLSRMQLFPAEKMLAAIDPGYEMAEVSAQLDLQIQNGSLHVMQYNADALTGAAWSERLSEVFYDCPPVKEFRRRYNLTRLGGKKHFLDALLKAYKMFRAGSNGHSAGKKPNIAILEFRAPYHSGQSEYELFRGHFRQEGLQVGVAHLAEPRPRRDRRARQPGVDVGRHQLLELRRARGRELQDALLLGTALLELHVQAEAVPQELCEPVP